MNEVELLFEPKGLNRGGIIVYSKKDISDFIRHCNTLGIRILEIDGFFLSGLSTQPSLDNSIDSSFGYPNENYCEKALEFVETRDDNTYFEIVCE